MNIIISGYGKMGKEVEKQAQIRGHNIVAIFDHKKDWESLTEVSKKADVVIDFTFPETATDNIKQCFSSHIPIVVGTTGWLEQLDEITTLCEKEKGTLFYAPNFSIGMNLFFEINKKLAQLMRHHSEYQLSIEEHHHIHKKDAPSGTAVSIAQQIIEHSDYYQDFYLTEHETKQTDNKIPIKSVREADVKGTHIVSYTSDIDDIVITHQAKSRKGFAVGAVLAAEFSCHRQGVFTMKDLLFNKF